MSQKKRLIVGISGATGAIYVVRMLENKVLFDYHDAIKDLPGSTKVRERLV